MENEIDPIEVRKLAELLGRMEKDRPAKKFMQAAEMTDKCMCGHLSHLRECLTLDTGVITVVSDVCRGCTSAIKQDKKMARVVCLGCRAVVLRISPHKHPDGFEMKANTTYHIERCPVCSSDSSESLIVEKIIHLNRRKNKNDR